MLDAAQARIVAYTTENGEVLCARHSDERYGEEIQAYRDGYKVKDGSGYSFDLWEAFEAVGINPLSRYEISQWEDNNAWEDDEDEGDYSIACDVDGEVI